MKLFFREFGNGKPLIILHGLFGLSDNWVSIGKILAQNYRVIIPDLRNHGQSPHSSIFNYDAMAGDITALMEDLEIGSAIIMGHSMGGKVAMQFALHYPEKTDRLIVVDMSMRQYDERQTQTDIIHAMMAIDFERLASRSEVSEQLKHSITDEKVRLFIMKNLYRKTRSQLGWRPDLKDIYQNIDYVFEAISESSVFEGESLFVQGEDSDYVAQSDTSKILSHFPQAVFKVVPDAGHWVHADNPEGFLKEVIAFLGADN
jgi:pimeloyl-ACP methyl ester carboxylesterase